MEQYYKNFILCGEIDYCCLLCQEYFLHTEIVDKHLKWDKHRDMVKKQKYIPKFRKDFIYTIPDGGFYCEICNEIFKQVKHHINEETHRNLKNSNTPKKERTLPGVRYADNYSVQIFKQIVTLSKWHGIKDDMCLLCDKPSVTIKTHLMSYNHGLKLVQCETKSENGNVYRKQGSNSFYCFTCFKVSDKDGLDAHWTECRQNIQKIREEKAKKENMKITLMIREIKLRPIMIRTKNKYFNFDTSNKPICLQCKNLVDLNYIAIEKHIRDHEKDESQHLLKEGVIDKGKRRAELADYCRKNFIMLNQGGSKGFCMLCFVYLSAHISVAQEHLEGSLHMGHLELKGLIEERKHEVLPYKVISQKDFINVIRGPFMDTPFPLFCLNDDICLNCLSYSLISPNYNFNDRILKCYGCDEIVSLFDIKSHIESKEHKKKFFATRVLLFPYYEDVEYIRQISPNLYHCGHCNKVFPFWENLKKHLRDFNHRENRIKGKKLNYQCSERFNAFPESSRKSLTHMPKLSLLPDDEY